jgi:hypothetical protein
MSDTPQYIKDKQLAIWLSKTPSERLKKTLADNEALFLFWKNAKIKKDENKIDTKLN